MRSDRDAELQYARDRESRQSDIVVVFAENQTKLETKPLTAKRGLIGSQDPLSKKLVKIEEEVYDPYDAIPETHFGEVAETEAYDPYGPITDVDEVTKSLEQEPPEDIEYPKIEVGDELIPLDEINEDHQARMSPEEYEAYWQVYQQYAS